MLKKIYSQWLVIVSNDVMLDNAGMIIWLQHQNFTRKQARILNRMFTRWMLS